MPGTALLILGNLTLAAILTGLIWTIQLVHYPGFLKVGAEGFLVYQQAHMRTISYLVIPLMLSELALGVMLQWTHWKDPIHGTVYLATLSLLLIWLSTWFISSPLHGKLLQIGFDPSTIRKLVNTNWIRTVCWSLRTIVLFYLAWSLSQRH